MAQKDRGLAWSLPPTLRSHVKNQCTDKSLGGNFSFLQSCRQTQGVLTAAEPTPARANRKSVENSRSASPLHRACTRTAAVQLADCGGSTIRRSLESPSVASWTSGESHSETQLGWLNVAVSARSARPASGGKRDLIFAGCRITFPLLAARVGLPLRSAPRTEIMLPEINPGALLREEIRRAFARLGAASCPRARCDSERPRVRGRPRWRYGSVSCAATVRTVACAANSL
jgi:hypothetical protein